MTQDEQSSGAVGILRRWDNDTRGAGIGDGLWIAPGVRQFLEALSAPGWVAEEPDTHLLPHLRDACDAPGSPWTLVGTELLDTVYSVRLEWRRPHPRIRRLRADAFALIGPIAESATFVRQRVTAREIEYQVTTGMLDGDARFAGHGHLLLLRVGGDQITEMIKAMA